MHRMMMPATEWDRELIADLAAERARLGKTEVVGVRGLATADEARLLGDIAQVLPGAIPPRRSDREDALVDALRFFLGDGLRSDGFFQPSPRNHRGTVV